MRKKLLFLFVSLSAINSFGQTVVPFALRYTTSAKGSIDFVSNAILQCDGTGGEGANCVDLASELPPTFNSWSQNNDHNAEYIDIDADPTTFSSSSDSLDLPLCSRVAYAAIYWGGRADDGDPDFGARGNLKIDVDGAGYIDVTADTIIDAAAAEGLGNRVYYCFADITDIVQDNPFQSVYTVANIYSRLGGNNRWGGWNIVVVYENDLLPMRNLSVFDGLVNVDNLGTDVEVGISGFLTPPSGPVTFDVGVYAYDGDRGFVGDSLLFDGGSGYVAIADALNPDDDIFNSSQTKSGVVSTSQNPLIYNNISIDADIFTPDNSGFAYIGNSETSASLKVTTNNETVQVQVLTLAIDVHEPDIRAGVRVEDINGGLLEPGDTLEYTVVGTNIGSDPSANTYILDTLANNIEYVPSSIEVVFGIGAGAKTDGAGDDQATYFAADRTIRLNVGLGANAVSGGVVANSPTGADSTVFTFRAVAITDCVHLLCNNLVENQAYIFGTGAVSGNEFSNESNPGLFDVDGCPVDGTTSVVIDISDCVLPADTTVTGYCEGVVFEDFPYDDLGYNYFNDAFISIAEADMVGTYYAIHEAFMGCSDTVVITITAFLDAPTTADAGLDQALCADFGTANLNGNDPAVGTGLWTVTVGGASVTTPTAFNSDITGLTIGVNTFVWSITNSLSCPSSTDTITITVDPIPTIADAGSDQLLCVSLTTTLEGNEPISGSGLWTVIDGGGTVTSPAEFNSDVTGLSAGFNTFRWTITSGVCPLSFADVIVVVDPDSDGDGLCSIDDLDSDNDGIPDLEEGYEDTDGDGIPDALDLDSDNDGIPDLVEAGGIDVDGDGRIDAFEDLDGDGLDDGVAAVPLTNPDSDGDGVLDVYDLDSDNDGTPDVVEAGGSDLDGDGVLDGYSDVDDDGFSDIVDTDDNTIPGPGDGGTALENADSDGDGVVNCLDLDSDNDGIADAIENGGTDADGDGVLDGYSDVDGDGFADSVDSDDNTIPGVSDGGTPLLGGDADLDGIPNYLDLDSDNDGILDLVEAGGVDVDNDGRIDAFTDVDGDGFADLVDTDDNTIPGSGDGGTALLIPNTDAIGGSNFLDIDADGDGISDNIEGQSSGGYAAPTGTDADGDGIDDAYDIDAGGAPIGVYDHDIDGTPDYIDLNSDNDGESDSVEGWDFDGDGIPEIVPSGTDADKDGLDDAFDTVVLDLVTSYTNAGNGTVDPLTDGVLADVDLPGVGNVDFRENDSDGDGIDDTVDLDDDNDGIPDVDEGDADTDGDGIPDALDLDSDNDGIPDLVEAGGIDVDGDGRIDAFEDLDGDGLDDGIAAVPLTNPDSDGDGVLDVYDLDSDNDGTPDVVEAGGSDLDGDGVLDGYSDVDDDGFSDVVDTDDNTIPGAGDGGTALANADSDGDGVVNCLDLDSDNDGIADAIENGGTDADGDGVLDGYSDVDGDGFADSVDSDDNTIPGVSDGGTPLLGGDADLDGIPNYLDLDSDNDGILDLVEAGGVDVDNDGRIDAFTDVDGDGFADLVDTDDNTIPGSGDGGTALLIPNTDAIGGSNFLDIDADGDGISDNIEGQSSGGYAAPAGTDADGDGIDDAYDIDAGGAPIGIYDHDIDGTPDYIDLNSDNDGESDSVEGWDFDGDGIPEIVPAGTDGDKDGLDDAFDTIVLDLATSFTNAGNGTINPLTDGVLADADAPGVGDLDFRESDNDGDGIPDVLDLDDDNDGIPDLVEDLNEDGDNDPTTNPTDTDGDGIFDIFDLDSDNDGIPDIVEAGGTDDNQDGRVDDLNPDGTLVNDTDNDGLDDFYDANNGGTDIPNPDTDGDGHADFQDLDSDNDGIYDRVEDGGVDADNDGRVDDWFDMDSDGIPDYADVDATGGIDVNGDGIDDAVQVGDDDDGDGIANDFDEDANGDGWDDDDATNGLDDTDGDGVKDRLDLDTDNDGTPDILEDGGTDANGDGMIDDFIDADGDGADDGQMTDGLEDADGDGVPDHEDLDSDNDGITDAEENGKPDANGDGMIDDFMDEDGDGWDDMNQTTIQIDTDADGIPDDTDLDSDGDGINDIIESGGTDVNGDGVIDVFEDENGDGLDDSDGGVIPPDTDGDGIDDYQDLDSDNDSVPDIDENDPNGDGAGPDDTDGDGIPDYRDTDDDNDEILTVNESDKDEYGNYTDCDRDGLADYLDPDPCALTIPTGFSPDGDGINDYFVIEGIAAYPNASLTIFNRWGNKVFESLNGYNSDWDGTNQFGMTVGDRNLPVGTYFIVLDLGDGSEIIKGYVFINK